MMNIQELATLKRYGMPVKIVLIDNQALGMVRQWQELFYAKRYQRGRPVRQPGLRPDRACVRTSRDQSETCERCDATRSMRILNNPARCSSTPASTRPPTFGRWCRRAHPTPT